MKTFAKVLAGLLVLAALAWTGMFLYWHVRILGAIRTMETQSTYFGEPTEALESLRYGAGCRALPYLVAALQPAKSPAFLEAASLLIEIAVAPFPTGGYAWSHQRNPAVWRILVEDSAAERQRKIKLIQEFWKQNGHWHHQFWRVWS